MKTILKKNKTMNYRTFIFVSLTLLILSPLSAQSSSETRSFIKTVPVGKENYLEVSNKYGTIQVTSWKKDSAYIRAEVKAYGSSQDKISRMFEGITVDIRSAGSLVRAQTTFNQSMNSLFESFKGMTSKIISYDSRVEIDYYINVPEYLNLKIENKYGDVYMEDCSGNFSISISNGSFKANSLGKESSISLSFCDATINSVVSGKIDASFSEVSSNDMGKMTITSISSKYNIKNAGEVTFESRRDKFFIDNIESMRGNSYFTDFNVKNLKKEISLTTRYGNIDTEFIDKGFEAINLNSGYSDISLNFDPASSYNLDIRHINTFLVLPSKNVKTEEKALNEEKKEYITSGTVGTGQGSAKVKIDATRGNIYIK
jgi:hypothetical protein